MDSRIHAAKHWRTTLAIGVALAMSGPVPGQDAGTAAAQDGGAAQDEQLAEIVVTGSRIVRRDYESQSPIVTVQAESFEERSSVGIESALNQLPQFTVAGNAQANSSAATPFPSPTACPGCATLNLRNLGTNRSLVLVDGRRVQPVNGNLVVDLNTIPAAAIGSVEVITGGAAAVYGADAISGVVNLILKKNFQGAQLDAQYGITQHGDGEEYQFSALLGTNFAEGRGNIMFGANYANRGDILSRDRSWVRAGWNDPGTSSGGIVPGSSGLSAFNCGNPCTATQFALTGGTNYAIDQNGNVFDPSDPLNPAHPYTGPLGGNSGFKLSPTGELNYFNKDDSYLSLPLKRWSTFASVNYNLTDSVSMFVDSRFAETFTRAHGANVGLFNIWAMQVPYNADFDDPASADFGGGPPGTSHHAVSAGLATLLNSRVSMIPDPGNPGQMIPDPAYDPRTAPWTYEGGVDWLPAYTTDTTSNIYQIVGGLRGKLPFKDWSWEFYGSQGKSSVNAHLPESFLSFRNVQQLFEADHYGRGWRNPEIIAVAGECTSGLPIFNDDGSVNTATSVSQDCADYATLRMNNIAEIRQRVLEANVQGSIADLWAGPLQFAAGVDRREENFRFTPDAAYNANQDYANVVNNIALPLGVNGTTSVKEAYVEFAIPVLANLPGVKKLEIDPGIRFSDYNTSGRENTWKVLADWQVTDWVRFRGGFQRANRAPNITELFSPVGASSLDFNAYDACRNGGPSATPVWGNTDANPNRLNLQKLCQYLMVRDGAPESLYVPGQPSANDYNFNVFGATFPFPFDLAVQGGNPNLDSERADTVTAGAVIRSPFELDALRRLTFSVDWYHIEIDGAIAVPTHLTVYQQCMDAQYNSFVADAARSGEEIAGNNPYCALIRREYIAGTSFVYGADRRFMASYVNLGGIKTSGIDVQLDWGSELAGLGLRALPGSISANIQYSHLNSYKISPFPGGGFVENKDSGVNFVNRFFTTLSYNVNRASVGLRWQHLPSLSPPPGVASNVQGIRAHDQVDLFGRWGLSKRVDLRFGIDNLLDADPEVVGATRDDANPDASNNALGSSFSSNDTFGRRFYVGARLTL